MVMDERRGEQSSASGALLFLFCDLPILFLLLSLSQEMLGARYLLPQGADEIFIYYLNLLGASFVYVLFRFQWLSKKRRVLRALGASFLFLMLLSGSSVTL